MMVIGMQLFKKLHFPNEMKSQPFRLLVFTTWGRRNQILINYYDFRFWLTMYIRFCFKLEIK